MADTLPDHRYRVDMASGWSNKKVGQIGEFLFSAEVARRLDCIATPFASNVPIFDVLVTDEALTTIPVQVKAASGGSWQFNAEKFLEIEFDESSETQRVVGPLALADPDLVHAFVWIGKSERLEVRFFILTLGEFQDVLSRAHRRWLDKHAGHRPRNWQSTHCLVHIADLNPYEDAWETIAARLERSAGKSDGRQTNACGQNDHHPRPRS
jgi:hypothetical protein